MGGVDDEVLLRLSAALASPLVRRMESPRAVHRRITSGSARTWRRTVMPLTG